MREGDAGPLVSCVMPTANRRELVPQAIRLFLRQDYANRELVIVDDGADGVGDLVPDDPRIRYLRLSGRRVLGTKRNECVEASQGDLIMHWDDDDWMAPWRIGYQVHHLLEQRVQVCGLREVVHLDLVGWRSWRFVCPGRVRAWVAGGTLCYRRELWERNRFPDVDVGEDSAFLWRGRPGRVLALPDDRFYVALVHPGNTAPKQTSHPWWRPIDHEQVLERLGGDGRFYAELAAGLAMAP
jgi:glycosyltransferase involved in cell wall biosynthesis